MCVVLAGWQYTEVSHVAHWLSTAERFVQERRSNQQNLISCSVSEGFFFWRYSTFAVLVSRLGAPRSKANLSKYMMESKLLASNN